MRARFTCAAVAVVAVAISCGEKPDKPAAGAAAASAGLARIQAARAELVQVWDALEALRDELDALEGAQRLTPAEAARRSELAARVKEAESRFESAYGADQSALADFLNDALNSRPQDPTTLTALRLYLDSALRNARDFIGRSGDYRRAIELLETARGYYEAVSAPVPEDLTAAIAGARDFRTITRARFDQLRKGMKGSEVKALVGVPYYANVRHSEVGGKRVTSWLYSRDDGDVAALYFDDRGQLYAWKWDAKRSE
jgi:hypothetical protein